MEGFDPRWAWLALGLVLAIAEMAAPGFFLIWLAGAAVLAGLAAFALPLGTAGQVIVFALAAFVLVLLARRWTGSGTTPAADPLMNDRGGRLVGEVVEVTEAIRDGRGRARHGDGEWLVKGPDSPIGARLRVAGHDGTVLVVEPLG